MLNEKICTFHATRQQKENEYILLFFIVSKTFLQNNFFLQTKRTRHTLRRHTDRKLLTCQTSTFSLVSIRTKGLQEDDFIPYRSILVWQGRQYIVYLEENDCFHYRLKHSSTFGTRLCRKQFNFQFNGKAGFREISSFNIHNLQH